MRSPVRSFIPYIDSDSRGPYMYKQDGGLGSRRVVGLLAFSYCPGRSQTV